MRPFSRGTINLSSAQPFDPPLIDPRYASNPIDAQIIEAALDFNTRLLTTPSLAQLDPIQVYPPADATPDEVSQYIHMEWQTEYHPAGTCAMLPLNLGGVVSPELLVYGTQNLRVVDSSIMPLLPAAHLQAVVYGVAEKVSLHVKSGDECQLTLELQAADIIKAARTSTPSNLQSQQSTSTSMLSQVAQSLVAGAMTSPPAIPVFSTYNNASAATPAPTLGAGLFPPVRYAGTPPYLNTSLTSNMPAVATISPAPGLSPFHSISGSMLGTTMRTTAAAAAGSENRLASISLYPNVSITLSTSDIPSLANARKPSLWTNNTSARVRTQLPATGSVFPTSSTTPTRPDSIRAAGSAAVQTTTTFVTVVYTQTVYAR